MLTECKTIDEISTYFIKGLVKSTFEQNCQLKVSLTEPALEISSDFLKTWGSDVLKILGAKAEKDFSLSQALSPKKSSESFLGRKLKKHASSQMLVKPPVNEKKKFEYKEDSQEFEDIPSTSTQAFASQATNSFGPSKIPAKKRKAPNVKF